MEPAVIVVDTAGPLALQTIRVRHLDTGRCEVVAPAGNARPLVHVSEVASLDDEASTVVWGLEAGSASEAGHLAATLTRLDGLAGVDHVVVALRVDEPVRWLAEHRARSGHRLHPIAFRRALLHASVLVALAPESAAAGRLHRVLPEADGLVLSGGKSALGLPTVPIEALADIVDALEPRAKPSLDVVDPEGVLLLARAYVEAVGALLRRLEIDFGEPIHAPPRGWRGKRGVSESGLAFHSTVWACGSRTVSRRSTTTLLGKTTRTTVSMRGGCTDSRWRTRVATRAARWLRLVGCSTRWPPPAPSNV